MPKLIRSWLQKRRKLAAVVNARCMDRDSPTTASIIERIRQDKGHPAYPKGYTVGDKELESAIRKYTIKRARALKNSNATKAAKR